MIPFIADALGVFEQELFSDNKKKNLKILKLLFWGYSKSLFLRFFIKVQKYKNF